jgi:hypothetical protein
MNAFTALVLSLPTRDSTVRMRVWRALKDTGCGVLRDGVYVLPKAAPTAAALPQVEAQVHAAGGFGMIVDLGLRTSAQAGAVRKLFDRSRDYGALVAGIDAARAGLAKLGSRKAESRVERLQRAFDELSTIDFYPGEAKAQAERSLEALRQEALRLHSRGEPHALRGKVKRVERDKYRARVWATRKSPWIDRLASAWLIKRFIDKEARFAWIEGPRKCPRNAVGFDFDGAEFSHVESRVTFEVLLAAFGLDADPALSRIGAAIHFLDAGGIPVAEAKGLETLLRGVKEKARDDDDAVAKALPVFDYLYSAYSSSG